MLHIYKTQLRTTLPGKQPGAKATPTSLTKTYTSNTSSASFNLFFFPIEGASLRKEL